MKKPVYFALLSLILFSCRNDRSLPGILNDQYLFSITKDTTGHSWYQNGNTLSAGGNSPHGSFKLRFNQKAVSVLNGQLELSPSGVFPDSSLIVKEIYSGTTLQLYAMMYKFNSEWYWAEYDVTGNPVYSIGGQGAACIPCHSQAPHRDFVRTFDLH